MHETKGCEAALFDPMRSAALVLLFASIWPLAAADAPDAGSDVPHTNIRKELLAEYQYVAPTRIPTLPAPFLTDASTAPQTVPLMPQDPDVVRMAPFTVREGVKMDALHAGIVWQKANARSDAMTGKLGIGVHVARLGPVGFYAVTVFFIPVAVGFGFSF
jgi:hypothetical protein